VAFQFVYTTLFGWYAAHVFLSTGHVLSAVLTHIFCNLQGLPDFGAMRQHRRAGALGAATLAGVGAFAALLPRLLRPAIYANTLYV
jgi:prenyl protein peptidase